MKFGLVIVICYCVALEVLPENGSHRKEMFALEWWSAREDGRTHEIICSVECKVDVQEGQIVPKDTDIFQMKVSFIISTFYCCSTNCICHALLKVHRGWAFAFDKFCMWMQQGQDTAQQLLFSRKWETCICLSLKKGFYWNTFYSFLCDLEGYYFP